MKPKNTRSTFRYTLSLIAVVVWTTLLLGLYYWVHKPLTVPLVKAIGGAVVDGVTALGVIALGGGLGRLLLRRLDFSAWSLPERIAAPALIGLGALSLLVLVVGAVALAAWSMIGLAIVVGAVTVRDGIAWLGDVRRWLPDSLPQPGWERFLAVAIIGLLVMALIMATLPPVMWDVLTYHLAGAEAYVQRGVFYAVPHNHFLGFPQLVDTLFAAQLAVTGQLTGGGVLHWLIGALMLLMVGGYTTRHGEQAAGLAAVVALLAALSVWLEMTFAYVDLMPMGLSMVALAVIERWETARAQRTDRDHHAGWLILLGVIAGLAFGVKYTAAWMGAAFGAWIVWQSRRDGLRRIVQRMLIFGGAALIVALPWLVRNALWYDNPLYPFVFESADMDAIRQDWYFNPGSSMAYRYPWQIPIMPLVATVMGIENEWLYGADIGPLFAMLLPMLGLTWSRLPAPERSALRRLLAVGGIMTAIWIGLAAFGSYVNIQTRLVLYMFPLLAVAAGITLESLRRLPGKPLNLGFTIRAMVALVVIFTLLTSGRRFVTSGIHEYYSADDDYRTAFLNERLGWYYEAIRHVNDLPDGTRIRFLWEPRTLYCDQKHLDCRPDSLMDSWYHARRTVNGGSLAAIAQQWQASGADRLLVYEYGREFERDNASLYDDADWADWDVFVAEYLNEDWRGGNTDDEIQYIIYSWRE
ncbi:MAG: hypothetical protein JW966_00065 [Anaerolineae bacterium]|nr:hypothetical protein [Anaerolineae bacterium]